MTIYIFLKRESKSEQEYGLLRYKEKVKCIYCRYLCFDNVFSNTLSQLKELGVKEVNIDNFISKNRENILREYVDIIGNLSVLYSNKKDWWATNLASKNRTLSPVLNTLYEFILSVRAIDKCNKDESDLYIIALSWPVIASIKRYTKANSIDTVVVNETASRLDYNFIWRVKKWYFLLKAVLSSFLNLIKIKTINSSLSIKNIEKDKSIYLIKSYTYLTAFDNKGSYYDPFFGDLSSYLEKKINNKCQVITIAQGFIGRYECYKKMIKLDKNIVIPIESFLYFRDILLAGFSLSWYWLARPVSIPKNVPFLGYNVSAILRTLASSSGQHIPFGDYLYFYIARRMAKYFKLKSCFLTYEGNHWEKMFTVGLRSVQPNLNIVGYQHSVVPLAATGMFLSKSEVGVSPQPNRIVTTGTITTDILKKNSYYPEGKIVSGCALRYQYLYSSINMRMRRPLNESCTILVALDGLLETVDLLFYTIEQAKKTPNFKFIIRTHPILPIDSIFYAFGKNRVNLPINIEVSSNRPLKDDIDESDMTLYWGSTVAVESLMAGLPIVHFKKRELLSNDPLFDFCSFKWVVQLDLSISRIVKEISLISDTEYVNRQKIGVEYVKKYFSKESEKNMKSFL